MFEIKKEIYEIYKNKKYSLYKLLYNLYHINKTDIQYGIALYNQICNTINKNKIKQYLEILKTKKQNNKYELQNEVIIIKPSHIIYKTKNLNKNTLYIISNYSKYIFICNFKTSEYYFIEEKL
jgi:hypothetical protein